MPFEVPSAYAVTVADFDNDGDLDIAAGAYGDRGMIAWIANHGNGNFGTQHVVSTREGQVSSMSTADLDRDGDSDLIVGSFSEGRAAIYRNRLGEFATQVVPPPPGIYALGQNVDLEVHFGFPVTVSGSPSISLLIGTQTIQAVYLSGSGNPTLRFRFTVGANDKDLDGIQLASSLISLNGGAILDPFGTPVSNMVPNTPFSSVVVNGSAPFATQILRDDSFRKTNAPELRFRIQFNEAVQSVDSADFRLLTSGNIAGASITGVTGAGTDWIVTVATGTGSGTIGIHLRTDATVNDLAGERIARGYEGGEVYTLARSPLRLIQNVYEQGHGDLRPTFDGQFLELSVNPDETEFANDEVLIYGNADALTNRPVGAEYGFLGVAPGQSFYFWRNNGSVATVPELGISGEGIPGGTFANGSFRFQLVGMRSSNDGDISVFLTGLGAPTVYMASSDGIDEDDFVTLQQGSHQHFDFAFSKPGFYEVDFVTSGFHDLNENGVYDEGIDPFIESGVETVYFAIDVPTGPIGHTIAAGMSGLQPEASDDFIHRLAGHAVRGNVLANDADPQQDPMIVSLLAGPTNGSVTLDSNGAFEYTPNPGFQGQDQFAYWVHDGNGGYSQGLVTIAVASAPTDNVLKEHHVDIGVNFESGEWDLHIHGEELTTEYAPNEALLYVGIDAKTIRIGSFSNSVFDFLGTAVGSAFYVLPQTENVNLVHLGLGTEELASGIFVNDSVTLRLAAVSGPGHFSIWKDGLDPLVPDLKMTSADGITLGDAIQLTAEGHFHANFAFSQMGVYQVSFVAEGVLNADGVRSHSGIVSYYFQVGNAARALDVQNGQTQRSFVNEVDLAFAVDADLEDLLIPGRVRLTQFDLNGQNGFDVVDPARRPAMQVNGSQLSMNWGVHGIGGNRSSSLGDGYYRVSVDLDGDSQFDSHHYFYRLFGDANGDKKVTSADVSLIQSQLGQRNSEADVDGNGVVNAIDRLHTQRGLGRQLLDSLWLDD